MTGSDREKEQLTSIESQGMTLFNQKCASCHSGELFTDESFRNTGMYYNTEFKDAGRYRVSLNQVDWMKFRVPSLRNVEYTAPYMHDGRFYTLDAVLNFYSDQVEDNVNLDPQLKTEWSHRNCHVQSGKTIHHCVPENIIR